MCKSVFKNLLRYFISAMFAFALVRFNLGCYCVDVLLTILTLICIYMLTDLGEDISKYGKLGELLQGSVSHHQFMINVLIYGGAVLSPLAWDLSNSLYNYIADYVK